MRAAADERARTLPGVRFRAGDAAKTAIKVFAFENKVDGGGHIYRIEALEKREAGQRAVRKARVDFAPHIARKGAIGLLEAAHDCALAA